ncbi:MAG TPA: hypothetical protein VFJ57_12095 [Solirubrobacterales bacterium]|nr:hypothetical protein [Solirubrobacterales bacterium]
MRPRARRATRTSATILALVLSLTLAAAAGAAPRHAGGAAAPGGGGGSATAEDRHHGDGQAPPKVSDEQLTDPAEAGTAAGAKALGASGQVDPLSGLGIGNPVCDRIGEIRDPETRLSCEVNGTPESTYPASNYGFDIFIDTGIDAPTGTFTKGFVMILNGLWLGLIFVLKLVLALLGLAFGLNPFAEGETMHRIAAAVGNLYARVTQPWLAAAVVCGGIWFAYKGLIRREVAAGVGGTLAALAMVVLGLWIVQQPQASVGRLASFSDSAALGVIGAPQAGTASRPAGSYAEAMSRLWARLVEVPFAGLDFSDVNWALSRPPQEAVDKADEKFCEDQGALALMAELADLGIEDAKETCGQFAAKRYGKPRRVIDLYLRSSPGSPARQALWDYFDNNDTYKPKVAAQGGDGVLTRLSMLALFAVGLLGAVLLLTWLAIRLFSQAAIAFVLLLAAPFLILFPLLGDAGRRAFRSWGLTLLGALIAKVIYAAFLSVVLLGITILGKVDGPGGSATGFLLACAFTWAVFLKRAHLVGWFTVGDSEKVAGRGLAGQLAAFALARGAMRGGAGALRKGGGALRGGAGGGAAWLRSRGAEQAKLTTETARESLGASTRALAERRHGEAERTVSAFESRSAHASPREQVSPPRARGDLTAEPRRAGAAAPATRPPTESEWRRYESAKALLDRTAAERESSGERFSPRDLSHFAAQDRELLRRSSDPADHAHRVGLDRRQFEELGGDERERAIEGIEKARARDERRLEVASGEPGRVRGRARRLAEGVEQRLEESPAERRERLSRLRRQRRHAPEVSQRRNLSRGGA